MGDEDRHRWSRHSNRPTMIIVIILFADMLSCSNIQKEDKCIQVIEKCVWSYLYTNACIEERWCALCTTHGKVTHYHYSGARRESRKARYKVIANHILYNVVSRSITLARCNVSNKIVNGASEPRGACAPPRFTNYVIAINDTTVWTFCSTSTSIIIIVRLYREEWAGPIRACFTPSVHSWPHT